MNRRKLFAAALMGSAAAMAQSTSSSSREVHVMTQSMSSGPGQAVWIGEGGGSGATAFAFIAGGNMGGKVVKGVPYSAEATTEMTRTLADGTRIINKHVTQMARDKEGRTRRENVLNGVGPFQSGGSSAPRLVTITDPVAKEVYILNYNDKTARKVKMGEPAVFRSEKVEGNRKEVIEEKVHVEVRGKTATAGGAQDFLFHSPVAGAHVGGATMGAVSAMRVPFDEKNAKTEKLPAQTMEGVAVEGTRNTHTIPQGTIGNDRPIVSTNESWYSNDLQMVIFSKSNDPQAGENIYRVQNLRRTEPDASLFKIPSDFKIVENSAPGVFQIRRKIADREEI